LLSTGTTKVGHQHSTTTLLHNAADGGQRLPDPVVVRHALFRVQRHVEIHPRQDTLPPKVQIFKKGFPLPIRHGPLEKQHYKCENDRRPSWNVQAEKHLQSMPFTGNRNEE
jgi:hypothetical protein